MEFHGTSRVSEIGALQVPWNSMELLVSAKLAHSKFHGIQWNCSSHRNWRTQSSMEFHGTACVSEIGLLLVPWNCSCHWNWLIPSSMEFHGTASVSEIGALQGPWNSMEFHGTARVIEVGALEVPWNSMELLVSWNPFLLFNGTIGIINALSFKMV